MTESLVAPTSFPDPGQSVKAVAPAVEPARPPVANGSNGHSEVDLAAAARAPVLLEHASPSPPAPIAEPSATPAPAPVELEKVVVLENAMEVDPVALLGYVGAAVGASSEALESAASVVSNGANVHSAASPALLPPVTAEAALAIAAAIPVAALPPVVEAPPPALETTPTEPPATAFLPPPAEPLPTPSQIPAAPALDRVDSTSSLAVEPPTPAPLQSLPAVPVPVAAPAPHVIAPAAYPFDSTSHGSTPIYPPPVAEDVKMEGVESEVSSPVNKRSAPGDEVLALEEADREAKRQKLAYSSTPYDQQAVPSSSTTPAPVPSYDANNFASQSDAQTSTSQLPAPSVPASHLDQQPNAYLPQAPFEPPQPAQPEPEGPIAVFTKDQHRYGLTIIKNLKKHRSAPPFLKPVDAVALNIPDYPRVITKPMDVGTIENKMNATGRAIGTASKNGRTFGIDYIGHGHWEGKGEGVYRTAEEFEEDVDRVWENCFKYNGPPEKNPVSAMAASMQESARKLFQSMPPAPRISFTPPVARARSPDSYKKERRTSAQLAHSVRRDEARPKRETHPPARDLAYDDDFAPTSSVKTRGGARMSTKTAQQQLKFCKDVVKELFKKVHESYAFAFYNPVDYIALNIPNYPDVVRRPMDLTTVRTKLDQGVYPIPPYDAFEQDVRLIFSNCYLFNPPNTTVHDWGRQLEGVFEDKWASRPMGDDEDDDFSDDDGGISLLQQQIYSLQNEIQMIRSRKHTERQRKLAAAAPPRPPKAVSSAPPRERKPSEPRQRQSAPKQKKSGGGGGGRKRKQSRNDSTDEEQEETVSFEMKRELAVKITSFEGDNLERAIDIIRMGRPDLLSDENKEIELDIDQLDQSTLLSLYRFVCPQDPSLAKPRRSSSSRRQSQGGNKRKNLDENKESERIEMLEARLRDFEGAGDSSRRASGAGDRPDSESSSGSEDSESDQSD